MKLNMLGVLRSALALDESFAASVADYIRAGDNNAAEARFGGSVVERTNVNETIGVINISGVITPESLGGDVTVEGISAILNRMLGDDSITSIVMNIDSPGGVVYGIADLAQEISLGAKKKPIIAYTSGMMASAAYWLGSSATKLVASVGSQVGSIGVYSMHVDLSRLYENAGINVTIIRAGDNKAETSPFAPLSANAEANMKASVDDYYDQFVGAVAKSRGVTVAHVNKNYGQGTVFNARQALSLGMIDSISPNFGAVLAEVARGSVGGRNKVRASAAVESVFGVLPNAELDELVIPSGQISATTITSEAAAAAGGESMTDQEKIAAAAAREKQLRNLAVTHNKGVAWLNDAIDSNASVEDVQSNILAEYASRSASTAVPATPNAGMPNAGGRVVPGVERETTRPWGSFGEFLSSVITVSKPGGIIDPRLAPEAAASGMNQGILSEGGFTVPPQWSASIWDRLNEQPDNLMGMTDQYTVDGDYLEMPRNAETSRVNGSRYGGIQGYWINEADHITKSKPKLGKLRLEPQQLAVLVYLTEKLIRNSGAALEQYVTRASSDEILFMTGDALVNGSGVGKPLGITNAPCKIQVSKESSQAAATVVQENISKMWARMHPRARANAVWLINVDVEPQFDTLNTVVKNVAGTENVGGYANKVWDAEKRTLKGRPVIATEYCQTLGTVGDIILWAPDFYATGMRSAGVMQATSMHVRFEYAEQALRFMYDVDGQPWLESAITPFKGSNTLSTIVTLQTR
jgi:HK97 family phage major capsid protein